MPTELDIAGFLVVPYGIGNQRIAELLEHLTPWLDERHPAGVRGLSEKVPAVAALARSPEILSLVRSGLGPNARLVRSILFNKSADANWQVAWHQDLAIAVREQIEVDGFSNWSTKDGVPHVQPPVSILERMLTVRLHLDDAGEDNGALWVSPTSHRHGRIPASGAAVTAQRLGKQLCTVKAGGALLLKPLILHASRKAVSENPRRVIHLEYADIDLPSPLQWYE